MVDTGVDERQLGRYAWTKFQGRHGHVTLIISVYVPCKAHHSSGTLTVINQHRRYFEAQGMTDCPRLTLLADIQQLLSQWRQDGDRVIAFIDANENMLGGPFHAMFTAPELQMRKVVSSRHPDPRWLNTASYSRGQFLGKWPIDGVYATPDLPFDAATWFAFMPHLGDHRFAVVDIKAQALVGDEMIKIARPQAQQLVCTLPTVVSRYTKHLTSHLRRHKMLAKLHHLYSTRDGDFSDEQQHQLETLDTVRAEGMLYAEKRCRKLSMGFVDFSPQVDMARKRRWLWKQVVKKREGKHVSSSLIKRQAIQCGILCPLSVTLAQACQYFIAADQAYDELTCQAPSLRHEFLCDQVANKSGMVSAESQKAASRLL